MKYWLTVLLLAHTTLLRAQAVTIQGAVLDADKQPLPLAHISFGHKAFTVAGLDGKFMLAVPEKHLPDTLTVTAVGFVTYRQIILLGTHHTALTITMQPDTYLLDGVTISNHKARNHWQKALQKLQASLPYTPYSYPAYYRQVHQENGSYVRLIEAGMTVYDVAATYQAGLLQERFSLEQVRRSNVYERNGDEHGDHLVDMLMENTVRYPTGTVMDVKAVGQFDISFADSDCTICGDSLEMLAYEYQHPTDPKMLQGKIWLYRDDMKIFGLEETATHNPQFRQRGISLGGGGHHWMFQESKKELRFDYMAGNIYLSSLHFEYLHHIQDRQVGMVRYEVAESFALFCGAPTPRPSGFVPDRTFARSGNLYHRKYRYEASYWQQFHLAKENPLPTQVTQPLSGKVPLDEQFRRNGE